MVGIGEPLTATDAGAVAHGWLWVFPTPFHVSQVVVAPPRSIVHQLLSKSHPVMNSKAAAAVRSASGSCPEAAASTRPCSKEKAL